MTYNYSYGDKISISFGSRTGYFWNYKYTQINLKGDNTDVTKKNGSDGVSYECYLTDCCNYTLEISKG